MHEDSSLSYWASPRVREKGAGKDLLCPYQEPTQVPLGEKPKACRKKPTEGTRQISSVTSGEGVPAFREAGRSD